MAVAIGAGLRFPDADRPSVQHAGYGPGGYYPRLGPPLSLAVIVVAVPVLMLVWPLS